MAAEASLSKSEGLDGTKTSPDLTGARFGLDCSSLATGALLVLAPAPEEAVESDFVSIGPPCSAARGVPVEDRPFARCSSFPINSRHSLEISAHAPPAALPGLTSLKIAWRRDGLVRVRSESSRKAKCWRRGLADESRPVKGEAAYLVVRIAGAKAGQQGLVRVRRELRDEHGLRRRASQQERRRAMYRRDSRASHRHRSRRAPLPMRGRTAAQRRTLGSRG